MWKKGKNKIRIEEIGWKYGLLDRTGGRLVDHFSRNNIYGLMLGVRYSRK